MKLTAKAIFSSAFTCAALGFGAWTLLAKADGANSRYSVPFDLTDDLGAPITEDALQGHPSLIYFGYTHCPEVCPTTLYEMAGWINSLGPTANGLKAFFFTVDPVRDTAEIMHGYAANSPTALPGSPAIPKKCKK